MCTDVFSLLSLHKQVSFVVLVALTPIWRFVFLAFHSLFRALSAPFDSTFFCFQLDALAASTRSAQAICFHQSAWTGSLGIFLDCFHGLPRWLFAAILFCLRTSSAFLIFQLTPSMLICSLVSPSLKAIFINLVQKLERTIVLITRCLPSSSSTWWFGLFCSARARAGLLSFALRCSPETLNTPEALDSEGTTTGGFWRAVLFFFHQLNLDQCFKVCCFGSFGIVESRASLHNDQQ